MSSTPDWVPDEIDTELPSIARIYDYMLGGVHNFEVDRAFAEQVESASGNIRATTRANRDFLRRVVRFLAGAGIEQFIDIGSGVPTVGNVHEIAQAANPEARVVYVDIDATAVAHSRAILGADPRTGVIQADARDTGSILSHPETRRLIDLTEPVGVLFLTVLHFISDEHNPRGIIDRLFGPTAPGSYLAISHIVPDEEHEGFQQVVRETERASAQAYIRSATEVEAFFDGLSLVEPGLVNVRDWRPDSPATSGADSTTIPLYAGVGRKP